MARVNIMETSRETFHPGGIPVPVCVLCVG